MTCYEQLETKRSERKCPSPYYGESAAPTMAKLMGVGQSSERRIKALTKMSGMSVDSARCTEWLGAMLLEGLDTPMPRKEFVKQWRALLPESWGASISLDALQVRGYFRASDSS